MTSYPRTLIHACLSTIFGVGASSLFVSMSMFIFTLMKTGQGPLAVVFGIAIGLFVSLFAFLAGLLPALLYFTPAYALLMQRNLANYLTVALIGVLPGLALQVAKNDLGGLFMLYGIPAALFTHCMSKRQCLLRMMGRHNAPANSSRKSTSSVI